MERQHGCIRRFAVGPVYPNKSLTMCSSYFVFRKDKQDSAFRVSGVLQLAKTSPTVTKNLPLLRLFPFYTPYDVNPTYSLVRSPNSKITNQRIIDFKNCCGASVASEQQHYQDLRRIYIKGSTNSRIHHFLPECIAFNQSALRHFLAECTALRTTRRFHAISGSSSVVSRENRLMVVMFCSDLPVKLCEGDRA